MIHYREGYKYQLSRPYEVLTPIFPPNRIEHEFYTLDADGRLLIQAGFAWDGASGPTIDTKASMRPSLVHDCFCQMMAARELDYKTYSPHVHALFKAMCIEDGMWGWRAAIWHWGVIFGRGGDPDNNAEPAEQTAP